MYKKSNQIYFYVFLNFEVICYPQICGQTWVVAPEAGNAVDRELF